MKTKVRCNYFFILVMLTFRLVILNAYHKNRIHDSHNIGNTKVSIGIQKYIEIEIYITCVYIIYLCSKYIYIYMHFSIFLSRNI